VGRRCWHRSALRPLAASNAMGATCTCRSASSERPVAQGREAAEAGPCHGQSRRKRHTRCRCGYASRALGSLPSEGTKGQSAGRGHGWLRAAGGERHSAHGCLHCSKTLAERNAECCLPCAAEKVADATCCQRRPPPTRRSSSRGSSPCLHNSKHHQTFPCLVTLCGGWNEAWQPPKYSALPNQPAAELPVIPPPRLPVLTKCALHVC
jgi:hypothetical protein